MISLKKTVVFPLLLALLPCMYAPSMDPVKKVAINSKSLLEASKKGDITLVRKLLGMANIAINTTNENGVTPLMFASWNGFGDITKELLTCGANPQNLTTYNKDFNFGKYLSNTNKKATALMLACAAGYVKIVQMLLVAGADVDAQDSDGQTALIYAILGDKNWPNRPLDESRKTIIELLLKYHANAYISDAYGQNPIYYYSQVAGLVKDCWCDYEIDAKTLENDPLYKKMKN
jgi:ankyrin repeat protein